MNDAELRDWRPTGSDFAVNECASAESLLRELSRFPEAAACHSRVGPGVANAGTRPMVDVTVIARVIDSLERRRGAITGLPADAALVAYDGLCYAFGNTLWREVEGFDYHGFLRATLGMRHGR